MNDIIAYYNTFDEWGRLDREPLEYQVNLHHIANNLPARGRVLDNGAGPGKYAMAPAKLGCRVTLTDLTPRLVELARQKAQELELTQQFDGFYPADARDLSQFPDAHFDASLMLGPLYHLQEEADRERAVSELLRVTKPGGRVFVAFMSRTRFLIAFLGPGNVETQHTAQGIQGFLETGVFNHADPGHLGRLLFRHRRDQAVHGSAWFPYREIDRLGQHCGCAGSGAMAMVLLAATESNTTRSCSWS